MMLVRICLIVGIVASLAAAAVSHFQVAAKIAELNTTLTDTKDQLEKTQASERKTKTELTATKAQLTSTKTDLAAKSKSLDDTTAELKQQRARADKYFTDWQNVTQEKNTAQDELAAWHATQVKVTEVSNVVYMVKRLTSELDGYKEENTVLLRNNNTLQAKLDLYVNPDKKVVMRDGLKGKVIAVDPKWDFVVLNIGTEQGALERGELLVDRNGKLVSKVRITNVERNRCIANIIPEYSQAGVEIMEGDQVIY